MPIASAMLNPADFPKVCTRVMLTLLGLLMAFGLFGVLTFGSKVRTTIFLTLAERLPVSSPVATMIELCYVVAILCTFPLAFFPAAQVKYTGRSGKCWCWHCI